MRELIVLVDVAPHVRRPEDPPEYTGQFIGSAIYPPVLNPSRSVGPVALGALQQLDGPGRVQLQLQKRRWSDGEPFRAEQLVDSWQRAEALGGIPASLLHMVFGDTPLSDACHPSTDLELQMRIPPERIPFIRALAAQQLSPRRVDDTGCSSLGPFSLGEPGTGDTLTLVANPYARRTAEIAVDQIEFRLEADPEVGIQSWLVGECHISCSTACPARRVRDPSVAPHLVRGESGLIGQVRFGDTMRDRFRAPLRRRLGQWIPREEIARELAGIATPLYEYWPGEGNPDSRFSKLTSVAPEGDGAGEASPLTLAFADYYPNKIVCDMIAEAWSARNFRVECHEVPYDSLPNAASEYDMVYEIRGLPFPDEFSRVYAVGLDATSLPKDVRAAQYRIYAGRGWASDADSARLGGYVRSISDVLPVLRVRNAAAVSPEVEGFSIDSYGRPGFDQLAISRRA